jgi:hypothetical protein
MMRDSDIKCKKNNYFFILSFLKVLRLKNVLGTGNYLIYLKSWPALIFSKVS